MTSVLVVGAGPTGLVAAVSLAARGVDVRVVDAADGPAVTSRANILHARGGEVLRRVGALSDLRDRALAPLGITMHVKDRPVSTMKFETIEGESVQALFVSQALIEDRLRRRLGDLGRTVEWGTRLTGLDQGADRVTARFADGTADTADYVIGADGSRSTVRESTGITFPGTSIVERFLLADVEIDWPMPRTSSAGWFHRDGLLLAIPMRDGSDRLWRLMGDVPAEDGRLDEGEILDRLREMIAVRAGVPDARFGETRWTSVFQIHRRLADDYRRGRVLIAGDAAHIHSPVGGQGMNTGVGDAENLAWKLAMVLSGHADDRLLDTYEAERRPLATEVLRGTTAITRLLVAESAPARLLRDRVMVPMMNLRSVRRRATAMSSQLWVSYRDGPLGGRGPGGAPRPGDRVADRECRAVDGRSVRLHDELGASWAVLSRPDATAALVAAAGPRLDRVTPLHVDDDGPAMLVRPDGHLAWRGDDPDALTAWIDERIGMRR